MDCLTEASVAQQRSEKEKKNRKLGKFIKNIFGGNFFLNCSLHLWQVHWLWKININKAKIVVEY